MLSCTVRMRKRQGEQQLPRQLPASTFLAATVRSPVSVVAEYTAQRQHPFKHPQLGYNQICLGS